MRKYNTATKKPPPRFRLLDRPQQQQQQQQQQVSLDQMLSSSSSQSMDVVNIPSGGCLEKRWWNEERYQPTPTLSKQQADEVGISCQDFWDGGPFGKQICCSHAPSFMEMTGGIQKQKGFLNLNDVEDGDRGLSSDGSRSHVSSRISHNESRSSDSNSSCQ